MNNYFDCNGVYGIRISVKKPGFENFKKFIKIFFVYELDYIMDVLTDIYYKFYVDYEYLYEFYIHNNETGEFRWKKETKERFLQLVDNFYKQQNKN
jgi:hypothetical protein